MCNMNNDTPKITVKQDRTFKWKWWVHIEDGSIMGTDVGHLVRRTDASGWNLIDTRGRHIASARTKRQGVRTLLVHHTSDAVTWALPANV